MTHPTYLLIALCAALAPLAWWLLQRRARRAPPARGARTWAYDLTQLGQESYQPAQRFEGLAATRAARPDGFDEAAFLAQARARYLELQRALDSGDLQPLRARTDPELYARLQAALDARAAAAGRTEVVTLQVLLVELRARGDAQNASVEFSGLVRNSGWGGAQAVREIWQLARGAGGGDWILTGIEALG